MAYVRSPKFYVMAGIRELISALIETWTEAEEDSLECLRRQGKINFSYNYGLLLCTNLDSKLLTY